MQKLTASVLVEIEDNLRGSRAQLVERMQLHRRDSEMDGALGITIPPHSRDPSTAEADAAIAEHELREVRAIDDALRRIEFDVFGLCTGCGARIAIDRLRAVPTAALCASCAGISG